MGWVRKYKDILLDHESAWLEAKGEDRTKVCDTVAVKVHEFRLEKGMADEEPSELEEVS
jgi:hypothetical protein